MPPLSKSDAAEKKQNLVSARGSSNDGQGGISQFANEWDEHYMKMALLVSERSRDSRQVGAVLTIENIVISTGYNGLPRGVRDLEVRVSDEEKQMWTVHAEMNAICNAARLGVSVKNSTLYTTLFPCSRCAGLIVQVGVKRLINNCEYTWQNDCSGDKGERSLRILMEAGVEIDAPFLRFEPEAKRNKVKK